MNNLLGVKHGDIIRCKIDSNKSKIKRGNGILDIRSAAICIYENRIFICQNFINSGSQGRDLPNKLGYTHAWYAKTGKEKDCEEFGISDIEITEPNPNMYRII